MDWMVQGSNPSSGVEVFLIPPYGPWDPHSLLYKWYRVPFPAVKKKAHLAPRLKKEKNHISIPP
jgi:hypothetical protein